MTANGDAPDREPRAETIVACCLLPVLAGNVAVAEIASSREIREFVKPLTNFLWLLAPVLPVFLILCLGSLESLAGGSGTFRRWKWHCVAGYLFLVAALFLGEALLLAHSPPWYGFFLLLAAPPPVLMAAALWRERRERPWPSERRE